MAQGYRRTCEVLGARLDEAAAEAGGALDVVAGLVRLREGTVATVTTGMLPEAEFAFLDELFNANSAILNNLLTVLNERVYRRGAETHRLPLVSLFAASNHLPEDAIAAARGGVGVDLLMGIGGTPEGVISAAAIKCLGGALQGRLWPRNDDERQELVEMLEEVARNELPYEREIEAITAFRPKIGLAAAH